MASRSTTSEKRIEAALVKLIKERGGLAIKLVSFNFLGLPDRLCLLPGGEAFFVEVKSTGKKPEKLQLIVHRRLRQLGFRVEVIDSMDKLNQMM